MAEKDEITSLSKSGVAHVIVDDVNITELADEDQHHLGTVRRLRDGAVITIGDGRGRWRTASLKRPLKGRTRSRLEIEFTSEIFEQPRREPPIIVGFCLPSLDRASWALQKMTELGVDRIHLLSSQFSSIRRDGLELGGVDLNRLGRVMREAAMQSRSAFLPQLEPISDLDAFVGLHPDSGVCTVGGTDTLGLNTPVVVGPEGGFTDSEVELFSRKFELSNNILRSETAAVLVSGVLAMKRLRLLH